MKRLALALALLATPALAQQQPPQPNPSQALAGQLATALAQAQDRIAELEAALAQAQAPRTRLTHPRPPLLSRRNNGRMTRRIAPIMANSVPAEIISAITSTICDRAVMRRTGGGLRYGGIVG